MIKLFILTIGVVLIAFGLINISYALIATISYKKTKERIKAEKEKFNKYF